LEARNGAVRVARESRYEVESWAAGRGDRVGCAEGLAQGQADDELGDRPRGGEQVGVQIAPRGLGGVVVQPDAPAGVLVPGRDDGCGTLGVQRAAERRSSGGGLVGGCPGGQAPWPAPSRGTR